MAEASSSVLLNPSSFSYVVGIDIGSEDCCFTVLTPQKQVVIKPTNLANTAPGFALLQERITHLGVAPTQVVVGLEATSHYGENLFHFLQQQGYHLCLLHPRQTHEFARTTWIAGPRPTAWMRQRLHEWRFEWRGARGVCPR